MFGAGCANGADCMIGSTDDDQKSPAWLRVFRNFEHRFAKHQCSNEAELSQYSDGICLYASSLVELQGARESADYDPCFWFTLNEAIAHVQSARDAVEGLLAAPLDERKWLASWM